MREAKAHLKTQDMLSLMLPEGGAKDRVSKTCPQVFEGTSPCFSTRFGRQKRCGKRNNFHNIAALFGKHNYGQTVATA